MFKKSTWLHLRIPFSFLLMPVFLFALSLSPNLNGNQILLVFVAIHFFLYPASNGYNSYFDKDEQSIGGLRNPPKVTKGLYYTSLGFDVIAIILGLMINTTFAIMLLIYGLISKAYSHPSVRIKKYPWLSWFIAGLFQGMFTFLMAYAGINDYSYEQLIKIHTIIPAFLSSLILWGSYPMTQIYQHEEDSKRGDKTLSIALGIKGTFYFTLCVFTIAVIAFCLYFKIEFSMKYAWGFLLAMSPVVLFFFYWFSRVSKNLSAANFGNTMWLSFISAFCLNAFFIYFFIDHTHIIQALKAGY